MIATKKRMPRSKSKSKPSALGSSIQSPPVTIVKPVDTAIRILRYLNLIGTHSTVTLIARELKINPSTCFNILRTLVWNGVLEFDPVTKSYRTGIGAVDLANAALHRRGGSVAEQMRPQMEKLAHDYGVTATVWRRIGEDRMMLVALAESSAAVRIHLHLGHRLPLLIGATGRVMCAFGKLDEDQIAQQFSRLKWSRKVTLEQYQRQIKRVRRNGWSVDDGDFITGIYSTAAPIFNPEGTLRGTVSSSMLRGQHDKTTTEQLIAQVKQLADTFTGAGQHKGTA